MVTEVIGWLDDRRNVDTLISELVQAHLDTIEIALEREASTEDWAGHVEYLQQLIRTTRAMLARRPTS